jgi:carboxyl-terminal processing protease
MKSPSSTVALAFAAAFACGQPAGDGAVIGAASAPPPVHAPRSAEARPEPEEELPADRFTNGAKAFADVRDALLKSYYAAGLTEDDLYRAATAGMLEKLEPRMRKYNKLLSPREMREIKNDLKGEVIGIGVQIEFDKTSGYTDVLGTIPGSPAEKAGLVAGDKIVTVNGRLYKGKQLPDVVADIRGKPGEPIALTLLRADKLVDISLVRERVAFDSPTATMLPDKLGYVRIPSFTEKTPASVREGLERLGQEGAQALVVDLRHSPGGSFERALETAELFVPAGAPIVTVRGRDKKDDARASKGAPLLGSLPLAVLVDGETASGAELVAAALHDARHARLVGTRTHGKWSVQSLGDLSNGWAYKYTVGMFQTPSGKSYEGVGVTPDLELTTDEASFTRANAAKPEDRLLVDAPLRTAKELLLRAPPR